MTDRFKKGEDLLEEEADTRTWGISDTKAPGLYANEIEWTNRIEVYSEDSLLRDTILNLLNGVTK